MIDLTKKYRTKNGYRVVGLNLDKTRSKYPIRGNIIDSDGDFIESNAGWTEDGVYDVFNDTGRFDLVEEKPVEPTPEPKKDWPQFDPTKQYTTRNGKPFRYYASDGGGSHPIHGAVQDDNGLWYASGWTMHGWVNDLGPGNPHDLIEVKPRIKRELWFNVYPEEVDSVWAYETREEADRSRGEGCIACIKIPIDCEHGEGLDNGD